MSSSLLPLPRLCSPFVTSSSAIVVASHAFCPPLSREGCSCYLCERPGAWDWVSIPPPLLLLSPGPLNFFSSWCAVHLVPSPLWCCRFPCSYAWEQDVSRKLVPSISSPTMNRNLPLVLWTRDGLMWSSGWAWSGTYLDMIGKQYYKKDQEQERLGLERGKNGF